MEVSRVESRGATAPEQHDLACGFHSSAQLPAARERQEIVAENWSENHRALGVQLALLGDSAGSSPRAFYGN